MSLSENDDMAERRSFRCSLPPGQQAAVLEVGRQRYAVRLLNESVDGAAVCAERDPGVKPDDVVRLSTTFGQFEARVVHIERPEPAENDVSREKPQLNLGLVWVRELGMPPHA
jgi:hypothetical protein